MEISLNENTCAWIKGDADVGTITIYKDGAAFETDEPPSVFYVIYDESDWSFIKGKQLLEENETNYIWKTPTDETALSEWRSFLNRKTVYSLFFFVNGGDVIIQKDNKTPFVNTSLVKEAHIVAQDVIPTSLQGNFDEYTIKTPSNVWCSWKGETEYQTEITKYCTTQVNWYGEHLPEADCTFFGNVPYEYNISANSISIVGITDVSPSENKGFSYPEQIEIKVLSIIKTYYDDYYFLDFKTEDNIVLDFYVSNPDMVEKVTRPKNRLKVKYTTKDDERATITYFVDS